MRILKSFALILFSIHLWVSATEAVEIVSVQTWDIPPYNWALDGFQSVCKCEVKKLVLKEIGKDKIVEKIRELNPPLLLAIGNGALSSLEPIRDVPILYSSILKPHKMLTGRKNVVGVNMSIPPGELLREFLAILPNAKRIGLLYDPANSSEMVGDLQVAAKAMGVTLLTVVNTNTKAVHESLRTIDGKIDAFWMLPDISVVNPVSGDLIMDFSMVTRVPIITFAPKYMDLGSFITMNIDELDMGKQVGEMANKVLGGMKPWNVRKSRLRKSTLVVNTMIGRKLGLIRDQQYVKDRIQRKVVHSDDYRFLKLVGLVRDNWSANMP